MDPNLQAAASALRDPLIHEEESYRVTGRTPPSTGRPLAREALRPAQNARSGLAVLAPEPHRTTRQPTVEPSAEPAFRAARTTSTYVPICAWRVDSRCRHSVRPLWAAFARIADRGSSTSSLDRLGDDGSFLVLVY
jgi:hypothetical protein